MLTGIRKWKLGLMTALLAVLWTSAALAQTHEDIYFDVAVRGTGSATIHADVYKNPNPYFGVVTMLAVHGFTETGSMFGPLAEAIYADPVLRFVVKRIVSIDLPLHGMSSAPTPPEPTLFGDLVVEDNAGVVIQAIGILDAMGMGPQIIMGHSMGGLTVQVVQELLLAQGSSLAQMGVYGATLIAAVPARGTVWTRYPGGDMSPFIVWDDPELGDYLSMPTAICGITGGFTALSTGEPIPAAPSFETCTINGWMGPEPLFVAVQLSDPNEYCYGDPDDPASVGLCRPYARQDAFALQNGTVLTVLGFSQDVLCPIQDQGVLYTYLTGLPSDGPLSLYRPIVADDAVHSMYISNPDAMLDALLPW